MNRLISAWWERGLGWAPEVSNKGAVPANAGKECLPVSAPSGKLGGPRERGE